MHTLRDSSAAVVPLVVLASFLVPFGQVLTLGQIVESTGFEADPADGGWEVGYPVCGSTCDPGCGTNPNNGWYGTSPGCAEPHISLDNPATGLQHLRFSEVQPVPGNVVAVTPSAGGPLPIGPTTISYNVAQSAALADRPWGSSVFFFGIADGGPGLVDYHYFSGYGVAYVYDNVYQSYVGLGYVSGNGAYDRIVVHYDPCEGTITYDYGPLGAVTEGLHQQPVGLALWVSRGLFEHINGPDDWDIDDYSVVRGDPCEHECGNNIADPGEECDGTDDANCPGRCIHPDCGEGACSCIRPEVRCDGPLVVNGPNGPFRDGVICPADGFFRYVADAPYTSINTCGSDYDTEIWWDFDDECELFEHTNNDCISTGETGDPTAPCADGGTASCLCVPTIPGEEYTFAVGAHDDVIPPPLDTQTYINISKKITCGEPIPNGACCDGETGTCTEDVLSEECTCDRCSWHQNRPCSAVHCEPDAYPVPTLSWWGLAVLVILLLAGTARAFSKPRHPDATHPLKDGG